MSIILLASSVGVIIENVNLFKVLEHDNTFEKIYSTKLLTVYPWEWSHYKK